MIFFKIYLRIKPKDYQLDGSNWKEILLPGCYQHAFCLMRLPELNFCQLWVLYLSTSNLDDEIGSITLILEKYRDELLSLFNECYANGQGVGKSFRKKLKRIRELLRFEGDRLWANQMNEVIDKIDEKYNL